MSKQLESRELDAAIDRALGYEVRFNGHGFPARFVGGRPELLPYYSTGELAAELLLQECIKSSGAIGATLRVNDVSAGYQEGFRVSIDCHHGIAFRGEGASWAEAKARACLALLEAGK